MTRLFVAIDLPNEIKDRLGRLCSGLSGAKWVKRQQMHLTLRFIGEVDHHQAEAIKAALGAIQQPPFEFRLKGVGQFPTRGKPRVLWVGVQAPPALNTLYQDIETRLRALNLPPDDHAFSPHITLARFKTLPNPENMRQYTNHHEAFATESIPVGSFILFSSQLSSSGSVYRQEAVYPLSLAE
jgi:2'-5' RNA ligase